MTPEAWKIVESASRYDSIAVAGMSKNAGKTESLRWLLSHMDASISSGSGCVAVTSVGVDGESEDIVTHTHKPEIRLRRGMLFATAEDLYRRRGLQSEVLGVGRSYTPLGRVVEARTLEYGKVIIAGPSDMNGLKRLIRNLHAHGATTVVVDGALSRLSLASPSVTKALLLATGGAVSPTPTGVASKTAALCRLIALPAVERPLAHALEKNRDGLCAITDEGIRPLGLDTALSARKDAGRLFAFGHCLYIPGAITDSLVKWLATNPGGKPATIVARDFTRIFATPESMRNFRIAGGRLLVCHRPVLTGITVNPTSPAGFRLNSEILVKSVRDAVFPILGDIPVVDPRKEGLVTRGQRHHNQTVDYD